ncbi:MAG: hypothetical protein WCC22_13680 [Terriglobales bacterium]
MAPIIGPAAPARNARAVDIAPIQVDHSLVSWLPGARAFVLP